LTTVIYRGPLERSRLGYLLEVAALAYGDVRLLWLAPHLRSPRFPEALRSFEGFVERSPFIREYHVLDGRSAALLPAIRKVRQLADSRNQPVIAVGFTALWYARSVARGPLVWCVNGIPEERLMGRAGLRSRLSVAALWKAARAGRRPDLVVSVSGPMADLIQNRCGSLPLFVAPNCVDRDVFTPALEGAATRLTYLGTGAPWQGLDHLARVWGQLALRRRGLRFRVVSRDPRARVLAGGVPAGSIEFRATDNPSEVARLLWDGDMGFLLRAPHIVNRVAFPTKFGEYVAAGVPVVATDERSEVGRMVLETGCGLVVHWEADPAETAEEILAFRQAEPAWSRARAGCTAAAELLDRRAWVQRMATALAELWLPSEGAVSAEER
jgi:glycosyltransferase involved in cell wall biosynthesis